MQDLRNADASDGADDGYGFPVVGVVPVEARGSLPFLLLHGESLVAAASWALGEAGVRLLDFTEDWDGVRAQGAALVVHDPLCPGTPVSFLRQAVRESGASGAVTVGVRPVTDTVRPTDGQDRLGDPVDRDGLWQVCSPVVVPAPVLRALAGAPSTDDLAELVAGLRAGHEVRLVEAPAAALRVADESDVTVLEALADPGPR